MDASEENALLRQQKKDLSAIYKRKIAQELASVSLTQEKRDNINSLVTEALDNMMPQEKIEENPIKEEDVVCKMLLKGRPDRLRVTIDTILESFLKYKNAVIDTEKTNEYAMTILIEKLKKS